MRWVDEPEVSHACYIGQMLRLSDQIEARLAWDLSPHDVVRESWAQSHILKGMVTDDYEPCGLCGVVGQRIWMLGTERLTESKKSRWQLCVEGRKWVDSCLKQVQAPLFNQVYSKNTDSIRWLKHLGFTVERPHPIGPSAALFCDFWREC